MKPYLKVSSSLPVQLLITMVACAALTQFVWAQTFPTSLTNIGSIANTRHNLSHSTLGPAGIALHNSARNNYEEVCVYCHTPHGANQTISAPLWNRTIKATSYKTYDQLGTFVTQAISQPGSASLTCLSCHDGQTAIDSIINMPGSGMGSVSQATSQNTSFLNSWVNDPSGGALPTTSHRGINSTNGVLGDGTGADNLGCLVCHSPTGLAATLGIAEGNDMTLFNIGTDLTNDHPIGVNFPALNGVGTPWNTPTGVQGSSLYFDTNLNGKMEKDEVRTYVDRVECASCHDPHGVPSAGPGTVFKRSFLRVDIAESAVCLTCHK